MNSQGFFPPRPSIDPKIYAYIDIAPQYEGLIKVGFTTRADVFTRIKEQYPVIRPGVCPFSVVLEERAVREDGSTFTDRDVHQVLIRNGIHNPAGEWFRCTVQDVKSAITSVRTRRLLSLSRCDTFPLRPEQERAVQKTAEYFSLNQSSEIGQPPHFLWNAKMRFGKTFATYQLAKRLKWTRLLILTFKPAVENAWQQDLERHVDFEGWQFVSSQSLYSSPADLDLNSPIVCFGSFQDYLGRNPATGGIKVKNKWVHEIFWDCVVLDEYHYGAWRDSAKELFSSEDKREEAFGQGEGINDFDESIMPINTRGYLYLSGTPFRAISSGEFIEEQIFNWTYSDEQLAKQSWSSPEINPYASLPRIVLMTYQLPDEIRNIAVQGEFNEFDLNTFFSANGEGDNATFVYADEVQKWLDFLRGDYLISEGLKAFPGKPPMPFANRRLKDILLHTIWFLPSVSSCYAMANLLNSRSNVYYRDYKIIVAAGPKAGIGSAALPPVLQAIGDPLQTKTITLTCGKLTTGITVKPWSGIFMLRNLSTPETYFQAAFRVQSPWTVTSTESGRRDEVVLKEEAYIFDFAPNRALRQIADYSCRLNIDEDSPEQKVQEFINFLPVLAYDGSSMRQIDAAGVLDMAMSGTSATLLARRWESALLVNVDNSTLERLLSNPEAMNALMSIEGFRTLSQDIQAIINKSESVAKAKRDAAAPDSDDHLDKKQLTEEEKEYKSLRKQIQEKLVKFATRIPVFMYLTDYRELCLKDVITQVEPGLFKKVTGLEIKDFDLLISLGLFNSSLMNDAVYKFKRYEDSSLAYLGIELGNRQSIGLFDTVIARSDSSVISLD